MNFDFFEMRQTADGSMTIYRSDIDETYHSTHGAIQESRHVFIQNGLQMFENASEVNILEVGYGTGLNAFLSLLENQKKTRILNYDSLESIPLPEDIWRSLSYPEQLNIAEMRPVFESMHLASWNQVEEIQPNFFLQKLEEKLQEANLNQDYYDLVYYDAFGPRAQGEMWACANFEKIRHSMKKDAIMVTYCAKGSFKRDLKSLGFEIESLPGPPGKREMTRARKIS